LTTNYRFCFQFPLICEEPFLMDIGVTIFITIYAFVFNLIYDHIRVFWVRRGELAVQ
ncbi:chlorhexidine efflux transporter, partial [Vibrio splendidus]